MVIDRHVLGYDEWENVRHPGILNGDRVHPTKRIHTPPNIHSRVLLHDGWPDLSEESHSVVFVAAQPGRLKHVGTAPTLAGAVLVATHSDLRDLAKSKKLKYRYLTRSGELVAVRVCP
jgi:hypothetical protein